MLQAGFLACEDDGSHETGDKVATSNLLRPAVNPMQKLAQKKTRIPEPQPVNPPITVYPTVNR